MSQLVIYRIKRDTSEKSYVFWCVNMIVAVFEQIWSVAVLCSDLHCMSYAFAIAQLLKLVDYYMKFKSGKTLRIFPNVKIKLPAGVFCSTPVSQTINQSINQYAVRHSVCQRMNESINNIRITKPSVKQFPSRSVIECTANVLVYILFNNRKLSSTGDIWEPSDHQTCLGKLLFYDSRQRYLRQTSTNLVNIRYLNVVLIKKSKVVIFSHSNRATPNFVILNLQFQFFNAFLALFYIAFFIRDMDRLKTVSS